MVLPILYAAGMYLYYKHSMPIDQKPADDPDRTDAVAFCPSTEASLCKHCARTYLDPESFTLQPEERNSLPCLICAFRAAPSFLDKEIALGVDFSFQDYHKDEPFELNLLLNGPLSEYSTRDLSLFMEKWLVHGLSKAIFGSAIPMQVDRSTSSGQQYYDFSQLTFWLAHEKKGFTARLASLDGPNLLHAYFEACHTYSIALQAFKTFKSHLCSILGHRLSKEIPSVIEENDFWPWLCLLQCVGEHVGYAVIEFPRNLWCLMGHLDNAYNDKIDASSLLDISRGLSNDWGSNQGLTEFRIHTLGRCPSEESFISSLRGSKVSQLALHTRNLDKYKSRDMTYCAQCCRYPLRGESRCIYCQRERHKPDYSHVKSGCTSASCELSLVKKGQYKTQHVRDCGTRNPFCSFVGPDVNRIKEIIESDKIPLVRIRYCLDTVYSKEQLEVVAHDENTPYLAISHVWSDGRGNETANSLLSCQVAQMYELCELRDGLPIWMDTLCIPCGAGDQKVRAKAIASMNRIYLNAEKVVVIAEDLLALDYGSVQNIDIWFQFRTSSWMRRFWTLQEGAFAGRRLFVRFRDRLVNLAEARKTWPEFRNDSPVFEFTTNMTQVFGDIKHHTIGQEVGHLIRSILQELKWRDTKWPSDQPVVFAGLLGLDPTPLLEIRWTGNNDEECMARDEECLKGRMQRLFERIDQFPTMILFCQIKRLQTTGLRWAPMSLKIPDWTSYLPHGGNCDFFSDTLGTVRPMGFDIWAHLILVKVEKLGKRLPQTFHILLEPRVAPGRGFQDTEANAITLVIEQPQPALQSNTKDGDHEITSYDTNMQHSRSHDVSRNTAEHLPDLHSYIAIVLKGFHRNAAKQDSFCTEGAVVNVDGGLDWYNHFYDSTFKPNFLKRLTMFLGAPQPLRGEYMCPVTVRAAKARDFEPEMSVKAASKRPCNGAKPAEHTSLRKNQDYKIMQQQVEMELAFHRSQKAASDYRPDDVSFSDHIPLLGYRNDGAASELRRRRSYFSEPQEVAETIQADVSSVSPQRLKKESSDGQEWQDRSRALRRSYSEHEGSSVMCETGRYCDGWCRIVIG